MSADTAGSQTPRRWRRTVLVGFGLALCAAAAGALVWPAPQPAGAIAAPRPPDRSMVVGLGRLEPLSGEVDLASETSGVLAALRVREGDHVSKGQLIAELSNEDLLARIDQANATVQMQQARLERLKNGARAEERRQAAAAVDEQNANLGRLQRDLARQKLLYERGYASKAQLETAEASQRVAMAKYKSSSESLAQMNAGPRREDVLSAQAEVELARAQLAERRYALEKTRIRAPFDGVILRVYKRVGESVSPGMGSPIVQIGDLKQIVARVQIDEADIARIAKGAKAYVSAPAYPGKRFPGLVTDISPRVGARSIQTGAPTEKRDGNVLDVLVTLDPGVILPMGLRVDCYVE
ncbi:HlyD family secretion protein [Methylobacterium nonmethylotrophicum]|uniref:HlyD family efflux transporter periplasmic adaptor subunit n=1 Tax=Methylobacterium nonmethylotrophicum TaxID=1141884 RepID=A0A4Z0NUQ6_9HYPH|nr:efflux RND transporter periplasmic adaptor subunit [Methylobacterium nonmethylotrophicum]TGE01245.1 HlyD family efflux transporter periplasmic adaptor subunit [Methylobacterium nonmethylotrophicum]